jgi:hypothetical protein
MIGYSDIKFGFAWDLNVAICEVIEAGATESRSISAQVATHRKMKKWLDLQVLPDGCIKLVQENSLLQSQLANCNREIKQLRDALLATAKPPEPSELVEVNIRRMEALADSALDSLYEKECQQQMRLAISLLRQAYSMPARSQRRGE